MQFEIYPLKGANSVEFGMTPDQVRRSMGPNFKLFKRGGRVDDDDGRFPSDYYAEEGVFFYYGSDGHLEAIEFTPAATPVIAGVNFFEIPMKVAVEVLRRLDSNLQIKLDTAWSDRIGIALWTADAVYDAEKRAWKEDYDYEDAEPEEAKVDSVLIAPPGGLSYLSD